MNDASLAGFRDKLYWRESTPGTMYFHCFKRLEGGRGGTAVRCVSLCGRAQIARSGGQASRRPEPTLRCGGCDAAECKRRGWDESGPTLEPRLRPGHPLADS